MHRLLPLTPVGSFSNYMSGKDAIMTYNLVAEMYSSSSITCTKAN